MTLFSAEPGPKPPSSSFILSIFLHGAALGLITFGLLAAPKVTPPPPAEHYAVRRLELHQLEPRMNPGSPIAYPRWPAAASTAPAPAGRPLLQRPAPRQLAAAAHGAQTLLQPDIAKPLALAVPMPAPTLIIWNALNAPAKTIAAPLPEKPPAAGPRPFLQLPNQEEDLAEFSLKASDLPAPQQPIQAGTTTPLAAPDPKPATPAPITTTQGAAQPTSAAVVLLSELHMKDGPVLLPPVNETETAAATNSSSDLAAGQAKIPSQAGKVSSHGKSGDPSGKTGDPSAGRAGKGAAPPAIAETASGQSALEVAGQPSATHIHLPKNGQFGAVVVGSSMAEEYPETAGLWSGRLAYTVYLHVGLAKSWILQYSLPRGADAAETGGMERIAAPWPYSIVTPNLAPGAIDADALIVHGFIDQEGRFEYLAIAFPPQFPQARFVLDSLAQWQFRPAAQNGQKVKVEVVLIIPNEVE
jgi:hypothetical protein